MKWFKQIFCFHLNLGKNPLTILITKPSDYRTNTSYWYCLECKKEFKKSFDFVPINFNYEENP